MTIKLGNTEINAVSVIEPYSAEDFKTKDFEYALIGGEGDWVRPSEWLDMPVINSGDDKVAILIAVPSGAITTKEVQILVRGPVHNGQHTIDSTIDWGDGSVSGYAYRNNNPPLIGHVYNFADLPVETEFNLDGNLARQVILQIDNSASGLEYINLEYMNGRGFNGIDNNISNNTQSSHMLDIHIDAPDLKIIYNGGEANRHLQRLRVTSTTQISHIASFNNLREARVIDIPSGITSGLNSVSNLFHYCEKLRHAPALDTSSVTNFTNMFLHCENLKSVPPYDTSSGTSFENIFYECRSLENIPNLDYSKSINMRQAFAFMDRNEAVPYGISWPTGEYNAASMFRNNENLIFLPSDLNLSGATTLNSAFENCYKLKNATVYAPNCTDMFECFYNCESIEYINLIDISRVQNMNSAMRNCLNLKEVKGIMPTGATNYYTCFYNDPELIRVPEFYTGSSTNNSHIFTFDKNLEKIHTLDLSSCDSIYNIFNGCKKLKEISFTNVNTKLVDARFAFADCYYLQSVPSGIFEDYNSSPAYCDGAFNFCYSIKDMGDLDLTGGTNSSNKGPLGYQSPSYRKIGNLKFASGVYCNDLIRGNFFITEVPDWDFSGVKSLGLAFHQCKSLRWSDVRNTECSISYVDCFLGSGAIEHIFNNLASGVVGQTINVSQNYGALLLHPDTIAIATSKGWTVTT